MAPGLNPMQGSKAQGFLGMGQSDTKRSFCIYIYICYPHQDLPFGRLRLARHSEQQMVAGFLGEAVYLYVLFSCILYEYILYVHTVTCEYITIRVLKGSRMTRGAVDVKL